MLSTGWVVRGSIIAQGGGMASEGCRGMECCGAVSCFLNGKLRWTCCFSFCKDNALLCRHSPGKGWCQTSLYFYLTSCCVQGEHGCQGLWKFLAGLAEGRWQLVVQFPILL